MHLLRFGPALVLGVTLLAGCSGGSESPTPAASASPAAAEACDEVRAGIEAFNLGDYIKTIDHFRKAIPLAVDQAKDDDSQRADDLVEAIKYYADLDPQAYPEAARSSADFAKYKAITLGQCVPVGQPDTDQGPPPVTT